MKKGGIFSLFLIILSMGLVKAYTYSFSPRGMFTGMDSSVLTLGLFFIILFGFIYYVLNKFFKDNKTISALISFAMSFLSVYYLNRYFSLEEALQSIGISGDVLMIVIPFLILTALFWLSFPKVKGKNHRKFKPARFFFLIGALFLIASNTDLIYEKFTAAIIGIIAIVIGMVIILKKKKK